MIENLTDLKYFIQVAETGNITRASERLGVTQPSLTLALQRLEHKIGVTLIERSHKGAHLTRAGNELFISGQRLLKDWERETRAISQGIFEPVGKYSFGVHVSVAEYTLGRFMPDLMKNFEGLEFEFLHDHSRKITEKVIARECDLGLVINPVRHPDLVMIKLLSDKVTLFKHPAYKGNTLIIDPQMKQALSIHRNVRKVFNYRREVFSSSLEVIRLLVTNKSGVGILPSRVASMNQQLIEIENAPTFKDELFLIYRIERKNSEAFKRIVQTIKEVNWQEK